MSHVKAGGSSDNTHKSAGRRNGVKRFGGQKVNQGEVLVRQTGRYLHQPQLHYPRS